MEVINRDKDNTAAWLSYFFIIGWAIALIMYINSDRNNTLSRFHLRQSLGIILTSLLVSFIKPLIVLLPFTYLILKLLYLFLIVLWIFGLVAAIQREEKPVPFLGEHYNRLLNFIR